MTLKYSLFGKPGNLGEFIDKATKRNVTKAKIFFAEGCDSWIRTINHQDVPPYTSTSFQRHCYSIYYIGVKGTKDPKVVYGEHLGDIPFYSNPYLKIYEENELTIGAVKKAADWTKQLEANNISAKLPFKINKLDDIISELESNRAELKTKALKCKCSKSDQAGHLAHARLLGINFPRMPTFKEMMLGQY